MKLSHLALAMAALSTMSPMVCSADPGAEGDQGGGGGDQAAAEAAAADTSTAKADKKAKAKDEVPGVSGVARLKHPGGATSASHGGYEYEADKNGVFNVPQAAVNDLVSHGFELIG